MSQKKEIIKDAGFYALMSYGAQAFDLVNAVFTRRFLGPASMGIWTFLQVIISYAKHASLGTTMATSRDVPYYLGKGDIQKANETKDLVFTFTMITSIILSLGIIGYAIIQRTTFPKEIFIGLFVVAVVIVLQRTFNLYVALFRAYKEFVLTGTLNLVSSISSVVLTVLLVWKFGLYGLFAGLILNYILLIGWIHVRTSYRFHFFFSKEKMMPIWVFGGSMLITDVLNTVLTSADRIMVTKYLGFEALGIYSIAIMAFNYLNSLPTMLAVILFPRFQETFSKNDDPRELDKFLHFSSFSIAYLFPAAIGFVWIVSVYVLPFILPKYMNGLTALKYLCLASFFFGLRFSFNAFIITIKKHWALVPLNIILILSSFGLMWVFIRYNQGINGVAVAALITAILNFVLFSFYSLKKIHSRERIRSFYMKIFAIFAYFSLCLLGIDGALKGIHQEWLRVAMALALYGISMAPLFYFAERELKLFSLMKEIFMQKFLKRETRVSQ